MSSSMLDMMLKAEAICLTLQGANLPNRLIKFNTLNIHVTVLSSVPGCNHLAGSVGGAAAPVVGLYVTRNSEQVWPLLRIA